MYLYVVLSRLRRLSDTLAAINLVKEVYGAENRGVAYGYGAVCATSKPISTEDCEALDIIEWH